MHALGEARRASARGLDAGQGVGGCSGSADLASGMLSVGDDAVQQSIAGVAFRRIRPGWHRARWATYPKHRSQRASCYLTVIIVRSATAPRRTGNQSQIAFLKSRYVIDMSRRCCTHCIQMDTRSNVIPVPTASRDIGARCIYSGMRRIAPQPDKQIKATTQSGDLVGPDVQFVLPRSTGCAVDRLDVPEAPDDLSGRVGRPVGAGRRHLATWQ
jgi:hypothetical protein